MAASDEALNRTCKCSAKAPDPRNIQGLSTELEKPERSSAGLAGRRAPTSKATNPNARRTILPTRPCASLVFSLFHLPLKPLYEMQSLVGIAIDIGIGLVGSALSVAGREMLIPALMASRGAPRVQPSTAAALRNHRPPGRNYVHVFKPATL